LIPRIFHQIWLGPAAFPVEYRRRQASWLAHHPGWELRFWTEKNLPGPEELRRPEACDRLRSPWERSDLLRLDLLWRFGGVCIDADLECLRSIEPLVAGASFLIARARRGRVDTSLLGAAAGHLILDQALDQIQPRAFPGYDRAATGSRFLDSLLADDADLTFIDRVLFDPRKAADVERAYAVRAAGRSDTLERLWQSLLKAEKRAKAAQKEASEWRAKYEAVAPGAPAGEGVRAGRSTHLTSAATGVETTASLRMPRIFHQIWLGPNPFPEEYAAYQQTWLDHHPAWQLRFWTEDSLPKRLRRPEAAERLRVPAERADILRLEVVWRYGGVYLDTDLECLKPIEPLIEDADFFTVLRGSGIADNYFFGATAAHPILARGLNQVRPQTTYGYSNKRAGPRFLNRLIDNHRDEILLLPPTTLKQYATHHSHRTHLDTEALRLDVLKSKTRHARSDTRPLLKQPLEMERSTP
jgi:mannosyltransferase OCH1-like enzyme